MSDPDYLNIKIPNDKNPEDYTYAERRSAEIKYIKRYGDPDLVPKTRLAEKFDVSLSQICQDFDRIIDYLNEYGAEQKSRRVKVFLDNLFDEIVEKKKFIKSESGKKLKKELSEEELFELYKFVRTHADWMMDLGRIERETQKHEGDFEINITKEVVGDDDD